PRRASLRARLTPGPAEEDDAGDDEEGAHDRPERAAGHRRAVDQVEPLPEPDDPGQGEQRSDDASRVGHVSEYRARAEAVCSRVDGNYPLTPQDRCSILVPGVNTTRTSRGKSKSHRWSARLEPGGTRMRIEDAFRSS